MKKIFCLLALAIAWPLTAWCQGTGVNPPVGSVWTYLGATYGAGWMPPTNGFPITSFGGDATGATDSTTAINNCLAAASIAHAACNLQTNLANNFYRVDSNITIPGNTALDCGSAAVSAYVNYAALPSIRLAGTATISAGGQGAALRNCLIYRQGMTFPVVDSSLFTGTAVSSAGNDDFLATDDVVMGFDTCLYLTGKRAYIHHVYVDCAGSSYASIYVSNQGDIGSIGDIKVQWLAGGSGGSPAGCGIIRPGVGMSITADQAEWLDNILVEGYQTAALNIRGGPPYVMQLQFGKVWLDYPAACASSGTSLVITTPGTGQQILTHFNSLVVNEAAVGIRIYNVAPNSQTTIDYLYCAALGDCLDLGDSTLTQHSGGSVAIGSFVANSPTGYAAQNLDSSGTSYLQVNGGSLFNVHGGVAPYFGSTTGLNTLPRDRIRISEQLKTDLQANSNNIIGPSSVTTTGNVGGSIAIGASTIPTPFKGEIIMTAGAGSAGSGNITLTFPMPFNEYSACIFGLRNGTGQWQPSASLVSGDVSGNVVNVLWQNGATPVNLTSGSSYGITFNCPMQ